MVMTNRLDFHQQLCERRFHHGVNLTQRIDNCLSQIFYFFHQKVHLKKQRQELCIHEGYYPKIYSTFYDEFIKKKLNPLLVLIMKK